MQVQDLLKTVVDWHVATADGQTRARFEPATAASATRAVLVFAHGAGGHRDERGMANLAGTLRECGLDLVRFNFFYAERESRRPDPMPKLLRCIEAVVARTQNELGPVPLLLGGRSMGGRAASMLVADGLACQGLLLAAYPLHPAGKPEQLRSVHLPRIALPVLCLNGTRDALCNRERMERVLTTLHNTWTMHWLEGADHAFHVLRPSGRNDEQVRAEIGAAVRSWLTALAPR